MSQVFQFIVVLAIMGVALILSRRIVVWKMRQAFWYIVNDLKSKGALAPETAVDLHYAHPKRLKIGLRDHKPKILSQLIATNIVGVNEDNKFYLNESAMPKAESINSE